ncbi:internalin putative [Vibrio ponticus]|nr:internalin putative [Vibrio ponticus]
MAVNRNASDTIEWAVKKGGVRYSAMQSVDVADVVNPLAIDNLTARVADTSIADADVFAQFMGLTTLSNDATTLSLYRNELANNPITSFAALETTIANVNVTANAFIDLQSTLNANITITQIQILLPSQYLSTSLLSEYQTALANNTWTTPDEVQALIELVNSNNAVDSDGDGLLDGDEIAQGSDPQNANHPVFNGGGDFDGDNTVNSLDTDMDGDGQVDTSQLMIELDSLVFNGTNDIVPIRYAVDGVSSYCTEDFAPTERLGDLALAVYGRSSYKCSAARSWAEGYINRQYAVTQSISPSLNPALPIYTIGTYQLSGNSTYEEDFIIMPMVQLSADSDHHVYLVNHDGSLWQAEHLMKVDAKFIASDGWVQLPIILTSKTEPTQFVVVPDDISLFGSSSVSVNVEPSSSSASVVTFNTFLNHDTWQYRVDGGTSQVGTGNSVELANLAVGGHQIEIDLLDSAGNVIASSGSVDFKQLELYEMSLSNMVSIEQRNIWTAQNVTETAVLVPGSGLIGSLYIYNTPSYQSNYPLSSELTANVFDEQGNGYPVTLFGRRLYTGFAGALTHSNAFSDIYLTPNDINTFELSLDSTSLYALPTGKDYDSGVLHVDLVTSSGDMITRKALRITFNLPLSDQDGDTIEDGIDTDLDGDGVNDDIDFNAYSTDSDYDGDGMSDGFETTYGFDPLVDNGDELLDSDNDGFSNLVESQDGSDPTDASSYDTDHDGIIDSLDAQPTVWNKLATGESMSSNVVTALHSTLTYSSPAVTIQTDIHQVTQNVHDVVDNVYPNPAGPYMNYNAYTPVKNNGYDGVVWQVPDTKAIHYTEFNTDGSIRRTLSLPNPSGLFLSTVAGNGMGEVIYLLAEARGNPDKVTPFNATLTRYDLNTDALVLTKSVDAGPDGLDGWALTSDPRHTDDKIRVMPSKMHWEGNLVGLNSQTVHPAGWDSINHESGRVVLIDSDTLDIVKNYGQSIAHQFGSSVAYDPDGYFVFMGTGDGYPRGIDVMKVDALEKVHMPVIRFKTMHASDSTNLFGNQSPVHEEISNEYQTFYTWSNDNFVYSQQGDVVVMDDRYIAFGAAEKDLNSAETGGMHNKAFNLWATSVAKDTSNGLKYFSHGAHESEYFYDAYGYKTRQENKHTIWFTDFTDPEINVSRVKPVRVHDDMIFVLMEVWGQLDYKYNAYMIFDKELNVIMPFTRMEGEFITGMTHELRVENNIIYGYVGFDNANGGGRLQRYTIEVNVNVRTDTDGDGFSDYHEQLIGSDSNDVNSPLLNGDLDFDNDGVPNHKDNDIDNDGIWNIHDSDDYDVNTDWDGDGLKDGYETTNGLNPYDELDGDIDSDGDGIRDADEINFGLNPNDPSDGKDVDSDGDGLNNSQEILVGTDPLDANSYDADGDGVLGLVDVDDNDPLTDNDNDGVTDLVEKNAGLNPNDPTDIDLSVDENNDGIPDVYAVLQASLPTTGEMNIEAWSNSHAQLTTLPEVTVTNPVTQAQEKALDLSNLTGEVSYEFIVHFPTDRSNGKVNILGIDDANTGVNTSWTLNFEFGSGSGVLGATNFGSCNCVFTALNGQSVTSPYGDPVHLVYISRGTDSEVWVNGVQVGVLSGRMILINHPQTPLGINYGARGQGETIYGFAAHNYALSADEVIEGYRKAFNVYLDTDNDGIYNTLDPDDDNDGVNDGNDAYPLDASESADVDGDGIGDNADTNLNDGPLADPDNDGIVNSVDPDADNDGISNDIEIAADFDPYNADDIDFSIDANNDGFADIWLTLQAALPGAGGMDISTWSAFIAAANNPPEVVVDTFVNQASQHMLNLSALAGEVSYEFVLKFTTDPNNSLAIMGDSASSWSLRFEQWKNTNKLGLTQYGVGDYTFNAVTGQSVASPYGEPVHLAYIARAGATEVWVNGVQVGQATQALLLNHSSVPLGIMEGSVQGDEGIYGFAAYNHALSAAEVNAVYEKAMSIDQDTDGDGIFDRLDPDDDNDGYLDNGEPDVTGYGTGQVVASVLNDINALLANNQNIEESILVDSGKFTSITSTNVGEYNIEFARVGSFVSLNEIQAVIDDVNASVDALSAIVGFANANDASSLSFADLSSVMGLTALSESNHLYYQTLIAADVGSNVDNAAKLQTLVDSANASQIQIDAISQYAANNNADALTIAMLQGITGLIVDSNNLTHYQDFIIDSEAQDVNDIVKLQTLINDADAYALDPQWAITGQAVANNISGATVRVFAIESGTKGTDLTKTAGTTDANGAFSMTIEPTALPVMVEIMGGTYQDEATGNTLTNATLSSVLPEIARRDVVTVSPLTDIAAKLAASDLTVAGINAANALVASTFLDSTNPDNVFAIAPADMNGTGTGIAQQYRSALIGLSVLGGGEALGNVTQDVATDLADNALDVHTAKALYLNTQTWLRRHGMTDLALNVPTYGLDNAAQQAVDTTLLATPPWRTSLRSCKPVQERSISPLYFQVMYQSVVISV